MATLPKNNAHQPLENPKHEAFARHIANGENQTNAYKLAFTNAKDTTARVNASKLQKEKNIQCRIEWLRTAGIGESGTPLQKKRPNVSTESRTAPKQAPQTNNRRQPETGDIITRDEAARKLSCVVRHGTSGEVAQAMRELRAIMPELSAEHDADKPDPLQVCNYIAHYAGAPGFDIVKELGGLEFMCEKFAYVLKVDHDKLARCHRKLARSDDSTDDKA